MSSGDGAADAGHLPEQARAAAARIAVERGHGRRVAGTGVVDDERHHAGGRIAR